MTVVKYCDIDIVDDNSISHYLTLLPEFMHREILRYRFPADQKARLLARLMLRDSISNNGPADCINDWRRDVNNKPVIDNWRAFNIAHAGNLVVFAFTTGEQIGIDIEKIKNMDYHEIIGNFHPQEQQYISSSLNSINCFYEIWAKKEALLKAAGIGIVNGLGDFSCVENNIHYKCQNWYLKEVHIHTGYTCYLCSHNENEQIVVQEFTIT